MNIVKLFFPEMRKQFNAKVCALIAQHSDHYPSDLDHLAMDKSNVLIALTDSRWRVIAFGHMKRDGREEFPYGSIKLFVIDPEHHQSGDMHEAVIRTLGNVATEQLHDYK